MKAIVCLLTFSFVASTAAIAQVEPAGTGTAQVQPTTRLAYALRYAQVAQFGQQQPTQQSSSLSGTLGYANRQRRFPFTMNYGGGYIWNLSGPAYQAGQFHRLDLNQGIDFKRSTINLEDNLSYLPQSPTIGFSGIPGIGEIIGLPNPSPNSSQTILTESTRTLDNSLSGDIEHTLNYATTASFGGNYELLRFPDANGLDFDNVGGYVQLGRRLSRRTTLTGRALYTTFGFSGTSVSFNTGSVQIGVTRRWTRTLTTAVSAGPQQIKGSISALIPSTLTYAVIASLDYQRRYSNFNASYSHGTNGGSGYLYGGVADFVSGDYSRSIGPNFRTGFTGGYYRTAALNNNGITNSEYGGVQATWWLAGNLMVFANYNATNQTSSSSLSNSALNNLHHYIGFGFGLSSREVRIRR